MTAVALAVSGWATALGALAAVALIRAAAEQRMALVAEAAHELRGPLSAALLGLHGLASFRPSTAMSPSGGSVARCSTL